DRGGHQLEGKLIITIDLEAPIAPRDAERAKGRKLSLPQLNNEIDWKRRPRLSLEVIVEAFPLAAGSPRAVVPELELRGVELGGKGAESGPDIGEPRGSLDGLAGLPRRVAKLEVALPDRPRLLGSLEVEVPELGHHHHHHAGNCHQEKASLNVVRRSETECRRAEEHAQPVEDEHRVSMAQVQSGHQPVVN